MIEKRRLVVINRRRVSTVRLCEVCALRVQMISAYEAAALVGVTPRTIYRRVEEGHLHFIESPEGLLLICVSSLTEPGTSYPSQRI